MNLHVLMTVYNEGEFINYAIRACLPFVKSLTIVEGAYRENIALGASPRSTDGTLQVIQKHLGGKVSVIYANEQSDPQQRNIGLDSIKKQASPSDYLLIVDGDEVYEPMTLKMVESLSKKMDRTLALGAYFKSMTFVNDFDHYCDQEFPRLFRISPECRFVNDNFMEWPDLNAQWLSPFIIKAPAISFFHYSFCKGAERFNEKKIWWENRFPGKKFHYSWYLDNNGSIADTQHTIKKFKGRHPTIMRSHRLWRQHQTLT
jgi:glycosyltransferase involved in cell wall biosynthesis